MSIGQYSFLTLVPVAEKPRLPQHVLVEKVHISFDQWFVNVVRDEGYSWLKDFSTQSQRVIYLDRCWDEEQKWKEWCNAAEETNKR